jgi:arginine decarboxylase
METIRVAWGSGVGPTAMASFDAALADAGVCDYNLVTLSSVVPAGATVEAVGTAPDLGPAGEALYCVQARRTLEPAADGPARVALGWAREADGRGLFYEAGGTDADAVRGTVERGLAAGLDLREWTPADRDVVVETTPADPDRYATAVAVAAYGETEPLLGE